MMSDVVGIIIGAALLFGGFTLLVTWWPMFIQFLMGTVPIFLMLIGAGVLIYFISEIKSNSETRKEKTSGEAKTRES